MDKFGDVGRILSVLHSETPSVCEVKRYWRSFSKQSNAWDPVISLTSLLAP